MRTLLHCLLALLAVPLTWAWAPASVVRSHSVKSTALGMERKAFVNSLIAGAIATSVGGALPSFADETLPNGVTYKVIKEGNGAKPEVGELVAIRFKAFCGDLKIDDIFETPEPYYTRLGSGGLLKGVEQTLPLMKLGDRWELTIPGELAFGKKGRSASAGRPRIPGDATIVFDVEMVGLPGKEVELIELIGD